MKTKIIVLLSVLIFALGIFCACGGNKESVSASDSVSVSESASESDSVKESGSESDSVKDSESAKDSESTHTHTFAFDSWVTAPGLETAGKAKMKCACGEDKEEDVPALGDTAVWTLTADVADPCVGGDAEYSSKNYGKVTVTVPAKHDLGDLVPAKAATCKEAGNVAYKQCKKCNKYFGEDGAELTSVEIAKVAHTPADPVQENVIPATCTTAGSYDAVIKCSVCGEEIKRDSKTIAALGHKAAAAVQENVVNATCTVPGSYDSVVYCSVCNALMSKEHVTGKTLPHTAGAATRENEHAATCKAEGSYEEVVKCSVCGTEMSRTTKSIAKLPHTEADAVRENEHAATCTEAGSYDEVVKCSVCGEEISRVTKTTDALGHTPAAAVRENEHAATCYKAGSYDEVVKCSVCGEEISKESKTIAIVDHNFVDGKCSMCGLAVNYAGVQFLAGNDYMTLYKNVFTFSVKGVSDDAGIYVGSSYSDSVVTFKWVDFAAGKITLTVNYIYISSSSDDDESVWGSTGETREDKVATFYGYFDKATGTIMVGAANTETIGNGFIVLVPSATVVEAGNASSSQLGGQSAIKAGSVTLGESVYSVFVNNGEVFFGVTFTDVQGNTVEASALDPKKYVDGFTFVVKKGDKVVAAYGVKDGALEALDSVFGSYTNGDDTLVLDGLGNATLGDKVGTYNVNGNVVEIKIIVDGKVTEYYEATLNGSAYTIDKPTVTVSFDLGGNGTKDPISVNKNTDFDLSAIKLDDTAAKLFRGWKLDGEDLTGDTYVFTDDVTLTANFVNKVTINIINEEKGNTTIYAGESDNLLDVLNDSYDPSHGTKIFEKYQLYSEKDGKYIEFNEEEIPDGTTEITIKVVYYADAKVTLHLGMNFGVEDTTVARGLSIKEHLEANYAYDNMVDGYKFDGWFLADNYTIELADDKLASDDIDVYAKWSFAGNVRFEFGDYTFVYDVENGYWKSNNQGVQTSEAMLKIYVTEGIAEVSFKHWKSAEASDKLNIGYHDSVNNRDIDLYTSKDAETTATSISYKLTYLNGNEYVIIKFKKDYSVDKFEDSAYFKDLVINGIPVFNFAPFNVAIAGTYGLTDGTNVTVGAGGLITIGEVSGAYSVVDGDNNVIGVTLVEDGVKVYKEFTLNTEAKTCTVAKPMVNVTYNYNGHGGENKTDNVNKHIPITLPEPSADGYVFIGWYTSADFAEASKVSTLVPEADVTVYAKWVEPSVFMGSYIGVYTYYGTTVSSIYNGTNKLVVDSLGKAKASGSSHGFSSGASIEFVMVDEAKGILNIKTSSDDTYYAVRDPETGIIFRANSAKNFATSYMYILIPEDIYSGETSTSDLRNNLKISSWGSNYATRALEYTDKNGVKHNYLLNSADAFFNVTFTDYAGSAVAAADCSKCKTTLLVKKGDDVVVKFAYNGSSLVAADNYLGVYTCEGEDDLFLNGGGIATLGDKSGKYALKSGTENVFEVTFADAFYEITVDFAGKTYEKATLPISITYVYNGHGEPENNLPDSALKNTKFDVRPDPEAAGYKFRGWYKDEAFKNKVTTNQISSASDMTLYAKWDAAATVVYYDGDVVVKTLNNCEYYENDTVGTNTDNKDYKLDTVEGVKRFVGWFLKDDNGDFGAKVTSSTVIALENAFYAKWEAAVTLTFDYNGQGTEAVVVSGKYVNDKVSDIPAVGADVTFDGKVFAGWFLKKADGSFGDAASTSVVLEGDTTYYAKWVSAPESYGTYIGWELYGGTKSGSATLNNTIISINEIGAYTGMRIANGTLSDADARVTDGAIALDRYAYFNKELGLIWFGYYASTSTVGTDVYIGADKSRVSAIDYSGRSDIGGKYIVYLLITYTDNTTKTALLYKDKIIANVTWDDSINVKDIKDNNITLYKNGSIFVKVVGKAVIENDGLGGTYTGDYGEIVVDGFGSLTVGGVAADYTIIAERTIKFVTANSMKEVVIDLGNGTYSKVLDGYEGTYTLPDNSTLTLDGYGGAGDGKTYVVSGSNITIYDGETSTTYGIDVANKKFLGKSIFADLTFGGKYYDEYDEGNSDLFIIFDNASSLSGTIQKGSSYNKYTAKFTAEFDGTTLTITVVEDGENKPGWVGKVMTATLSGDTFTVVSWNGYKTVSSEKMYYFVGAKLKCEGFSL